MRGATKVNKVKEAISATVDTMFFGHPTTDRPKFPHWTQGLLYSIHEAPHSKAAYNSEEKNTSLHLCWIVSAKILLTVVAILVVGVAAKYMAQSILLIHILRAPPQTQQVEVRPTHKRQQLITISDKVHLYNIPNDLEKTLPRALEAFLSANYIMT